MYGIFIWIWASSWFDRIFGEQRVPAPQEPQQHVAREHSGVHPGDLRHAGGALAEEPRQVVPPGAARGVHVPPRPAARLPPPERPQQASSSPGAAFPGPHRVAVRVSGGELPAWLAQDLNNNKLKAKCIRYGYTLRWATTDATSLPQRDKDRRAGSTFLKEAEDLDEANVVVAPAPNTP